MALQHVKLANIQYVGATAGSLYTNGSSTTTLLAGVALFNGNTSAETVKIYVVPASGGALGTAGVANQLFELVLAAKTTAFLEFPYAVVLSDTNDSLQASTTTASKVTAVVCGDKVA